MKYRIETITKIETKGEVMNTLLINMEVVVKMVEENWSLLVEAVVLESISSSQAAGLDWPVHPKLM